jgi:hypothetical protein
MLMRCAASHRVFCSFALSSKRKVRRKFTVKWKQSISVTDVHSYLGQGPSTLVWSFTLMRMFWRMKLIYPINVCIHTSLWHDGYKGKKHNKQSQLNFGSYIMLNLLLVSALLSHHQVSVYTKTFLENLTTSNIPKNFVVLYTIFTISFYKFKYLSMTV